MTILGNSDHFTSGAAVVIDGQVVAAVNEERLACKKMVMGFPRKSIAEVLRLAGQTAGTGPLRGRLRMGLLPE
jgi:carbamoyltransferase